MTTESDREMLELAARAYWGDEIDDVCSIRWLEQDQAIGYTHGDNQDHNGQDREFVWNPLTNDGDALRLAVRCRITDLALVVGQYIVSSSYRTSDDMCAITRRAITHAAAEIARATHKEGA